MSRPKNRLTFATFITLCTVITLISGQTAAAQDKLVIISPHWEGIETEFDTGFKTWYTKETGTRSHCRLARSGRIVFRFPLHRIRIQTAARTVSG